MITTWPTIDTLGLHPELHVTEQLITPPSIEPIDLDEVKKHLRFTPTSEDTLLDTYIAMARQYFEEYTGLQLITATWEQQMDVFPGGATVTTNVIELRHPPLIDVISVAYDDSDGVEQILDVGTDPAYFVETPRAPQCGFIRLGDGGTWPTPVGTLGSVRIRYRAGFGDQPGDVPELIKGALYFLVGHFHQYRVEVVDQTRGSLSVLPIGAQAIMRAFKSWPVRPPMRRG